jgi:competence protein ComEC
MTKVHFLNVGHGDCTIIEHPSGRITMLDICNAKSLDDDSRKELAQGYGITGPSYQTKLAAARLAGLSFRETFLAEKGYDVELTDPVDYYKQHWGQKEIFRYIQSHADLDHMRGLHRLYQEGIPILNFWDTDHEKRVTDFKGDDEVHWDHYQLLRNSTENPRIHKKFRKEAGSFWNQDEAGGMGDGLHILAPTMELKNAANLSGDTNAHSYVLWLEYAGIKVMLGGDATFDVWQYLFDTHGAHLKCHVLKASHHGRDSGYHQEAVKAMSPEYTIVSVGTKPDTDASNKYRQYSPNVWSTRWRGNIILTIEADGTAKIESQHNQETPATASAN